MGRVIGLDYGSSNIGVAISDPLNITAQGHSVMRRSNLEADFQKLKEIIETYEVSRIVVGFPKNMNNTVGPLAQQAQAFAKELGEYTGLEVILWDERLSSREAEGVLRASGRSAKEQRGVIDMVAAAIILDSYLRQESVTILNSLESCSNLAP